MGAIWYQFDWTLLKEPHLRDVEMDSFRSVLRLLESLPFIIFRKKMYVASSEEGHGRGGRWWGVVLMLNKLSVLFVSLRPSQAFFFSFKNRICT